MDQGFFCRIRGVDGVAHNCEGAARSPPLAAGRTDARNGENLRFCKKKSCGIQMPGSTPRLLLPRGGLVSSGLADPAGSMPRERRLGTAVFPDPEATAAHQRWRAD